jgi:hypothetical protein
VAALSTIIFYRTMDNNNNFNLNFSLLNITVTDSDVQINNDFQGAITYAWDSDFAITNNLQIVKIVQRVRAIDAESKAPLASLSMEVNFTAVGMEQLRQDDKLSLPHSVLQELFVLVSRIVTGALALAAKGTALERNPLPLLNTANFPMQQGQSA